ncbi:TPA: hypothetical protein U1312_000334 [Streptococcus suis]|nr:hypothetical protein [Streptococcus suis]
MVADKPTFYLQSEHKLEISEDGKTWMRLAGGISELEPDGNEEVSQDAYLDGSESDVTGGQLVLALTGHRLVGDKAQDWLYARQFQYGGKRRGFTRWTLPGGKTQFTFASTFANIKGPSGAANGKGEIEFEIHSNEELVPNKVVAEVTKTNKELASEALGVERQVQE